MRRIASRPLAAFVALGLAAALIAVGVSAAVATAGQAGSRVSETPAPHGEPIDVPPVDAPTVLVGAGDIATCGGGERATSDLLERIPGIVIALGDNAYEDGTAAQYRDCYAPTWGHELDRTRPTPGNHDYHTPNAAPYFQYFGAAAGPAGLGYYSYPAGGWHIVVLNSNCQQVPCSKGSPQYAWLSADLAAHPARCTLAYWHHPRFSSGEHGPTTEMSDIWQLLYDRGAEVVLSGHDHEYERFAPQDGLGNPDAARGVRQFVVGTGGGELRQIVARARNSEFVRTSTYGVIRLELYADRYAWSFIASDGTTLDSGESSCH